jgi:hypothetical protein
MSCEKKIKLLLTVAIIGAVLWLGGLFLLVVSKPIGIASVFLGICACAGVMGFCLTDRNTDDY